MIHHTVFAWHVNADFPFLDWVRFVLGGPVRNLWPLFLAPAAAAWVAERTARRLPRTPEAALAAAVLAAVPGLVAVGALVIATTAWAPFSTWQGLLLHRLTPVIGLALVGFAALRMARGWRDVRRLFRLATPPGDRLRAAASRVGLRALELPTDDAECFLAGVARPTAFVSRGALTRLDAAELAAALAHERAHAMGCDTLSLTVLGFLRGLAPYGQGRALAAFQAAREAAADAYAASHSGATELASALLALARPWPRSAAVLPMADAATLSWRLERLLGDSAEAPVRLGPRVAATAGLVAWPALQILLFAMFC